MALLSASPGLSPSFSWPGVEVSLRILSPLLFPRLLPWQCPTLLHSSEPTSASLTLTSLPHFHPAGCTARLNSVFPRLGSFFFLRWILFSTPSFYPQTRCLLRLPACKLSLAPRLPSLSLPHPNLPNWSWWRFFNTFAPSSPVYISIPVFKLPYPCPSSGVSCESSTALCRFPEDCSVPRCPSLSEQ